MGFVVSQIRYALGPDSLGTSACPDGHSLNPLEIHARSAAGKRQPGETDKAYSDRLFAGARSANTQADGTMICMNPAAAPADTHFRTLQSDDVRVEGFDLDEENSQGDARPGQCTHRDFTGTDGSPGVDNQFYRVVGCLRSYQSSGQSNGYTIEMLTGSWGILITVDGVDDLKNDDSVDVGFFANADPIRLSPGRDPLTYASYTTDSDPRFRAHARGRITDGVLVTEPTDVRFHQVVNSMILERPLHAARVRMQLSADGVMEGWLAGYTPVEELYDYQFGYRNGKTRTGELAPMRLRAGSSFGASVVLGHTCQGVYQTLYRLADAEPEPQTGRCTAISVQYRLQAIPAFVMDETATAAAATTGAAP